jgi:hypothetical protein
MIVADALYAAPGHCCIVSYLSERESLPGDEDLGQRVQARAGHLLQTRGADKTPRQSTHIRVNRGIGGMLHRLLVGDSSGAQRVMGWIGVRHRLLVGSTSGSRRVMGWNSGVLHRHGRWTSGYNSGGKRG